MVDDALWPYHTAYKAPLGSTLYLLVFGKSYHLPVELERKAYWAIKMLNFDLKTVREKFNLVELLKWWSESTGEFTVK